MKTIPITPNCRLGGPFLLCRPGYWRSGVWPALPSDTPYQSKYEGSFAPSRLEFRARSKRIEMTTKSQRKHCTIRYDALLGDRAPAIWPEDVHCALNKWNTAVPDARNLAHRQAARISHLTIGRARATDAKPNQQPHLTIGCARATDAKPPKPNHT